MSAVAHNTRSGDMDLWAQNSCLRGLISKESSVMLGNGVLLVTRNGSERFVFSAGKGFNSRRDAKHLR